MEDLETWNLQENSGGELRVRGELRRTQNFSKILKILEILRFLESYFFIELSSERCTRKKTGFLFLGRSPKKGLTRLLSIGVA